ncbi:NADPH oxidase organizer 1a [Aplochiton taeniatus]
MEGPRYPVSIRLIGVMQTEKSKMYMTSVLWSDDNDIIIYRTFEEFKQLHRQMKKSFPPENPLKKNTRIIPRFQAKKMKRTVQKRDPSKSVLSLKFLEKYCTELLRCSPRVAESQDLIQFFHPKDQDITPEFAKNSVVIMPSDDAIDGGENDSIQVGNVTQPFLTETYRCVAPYETKDTKNRPFKVKVDEKLDVLIKDKAGWWLVENEDKKLAWFPAPYLEKMGDDYDEEGENTEDYGESLMYTVARSYKATHEDEVSVEMGSVVEVLQKTNNGWWLVRSGSKPGYVPSMYLQPYSDPRLRMAAIHQERRSSTVSLCQLNAQTPKTLGATSPELSGSQGNLLRPPGFQPANKLTSRSLNLLPPPGPARPKAGTTLGPQRANPSSPTSPAYRPPPIIRVEADAGEDQPGRSLAGNRQGSLGSESSDFSSSDELNSSTCSFSLSLSPCDVDMPQRSSSTLPAVEADRPSADTSTGSSRMILGTSEPNLAKPPGTPIVPPRPAAQEILTRCTTVTRKNASKAQGYSLSR